MLKINTKSSKKPFYIALTAGFLYLAILAFTYGVKVFGFGGTLTTYGSVFGILALCVLVFAVKFRLMLAGLSIISVIIGPGISCGKIVI